MGDSVGELLSQAVTEGRVRDSLPPILRRHFQHAVSVRLALLGPLPGVAVSTNLLTAGAVTFHVFGNASLTGSVIINGRAALVDSTRSPELASDVASLVREEGSRMFWCVPVVASGSAPQATGSSTTLIEAGALGALLLSYRSAGDVSPAELKAALLAGQQVAEQGGSTLAGYLSRVSDSLAPAEHTRWGPFATPAADSPAPSAGGPPSESDLLLASDSEGEWELREQGQPWAVQHHASPRWGGAGPPPLFIPGQEQRREALLRGMSPWTLAFPDQRTEAAFQGWRSGSMARVDTAALAALLAYHSSAYLLAPGLRHGNPLAAAQLLPSTALLLPLLLLLSGPQALAWYKRHRDSLLLLLYATLCIWHCAGAAAYEHRAALAAATTRTGNWQGAVARAECAWVLLLGVVLQARFTFHAGAVGTSLMLLAAMRAGTYKPLLRAVLALLGPAWQQGQLLQAAVTMCSMLRPLMRSCSLQLLLAAALVYYLERAARSAFLRMPLALQHLHED